MDPAHRLGELEDSELAGIPEEFVTSPGWSVKLINPAVAANQPASPANDSRVQNMADDLLPTAVHMANFYHLPFGESLNMVYIDSRSGIEENAAVLLRFLTEISGSHQAWIPLAASHSLLLNALQQILPQIQQLDLSSNPLLYIGDYANFTSIRHIGDVCDMPVFCQATF